MAGVYKRKSDRERGKGGKWVMWWRDAGGKRCRKVGSTDKAKSLEVARHLEAEAIREREGLVDPGERARRHASLRPVADHVADYRLHLIAGGDTAKHARHVAGVLSRVLDDAGIATVADLAPDRIQAALGRLGVRRSARTVNHALAAVRAFAAWLAESNRVSEVPRGLASIPRRNERADVRLARRALSIAELEKLCTVAEAGPDHYIYGKTKSKHSRVPIPGRDRALLYRLAMGTGFRANELRSLTPESFALDGPEPAVTVRAAYTKNKREAVQPIPRALADAIRPLVEGRPPGQPLVVVPEKTAAMLARDLAAAGIPVETPEGVVDFHALRASYITHLIRSGANPKVVQLLARHSTVTLTLERYTKMGSGDLRDAIESPDPGV